MSLCLTCSLFSAAEAPETKAFQQQLVRDLGRSLEIQHAGMARAKQASQKRADRGYSYNLAAMTALHSTTGEARLLDWARDDMLWTVESAIQNGEARPFLTSFRNLQPFCEAYFYLREKGRLSAAEQKRIEDQIRASARTHYDYTDWGAHNRATVDGASFLWAAKAIPRDPEVETWRRYGDALLHDSWGKWPIEDASIYNPFWLFYLMTAGEATDRVDEVMGFVTTRYYFEFYSRLLMPNEMLPDWGDGDWTHQWQWYTADMVRAGSYYRNGKYLHFARQLYSYYMGSGPGSVKVSVAGVAIDKATGNKLLTGDAVYCAGAAVRWLHLSVPIVPYKIARSEEVLDDLVGKKIVFRNDKGGESGYAMLNYRDEGPYARYQRDYLNQQLAAYQEKPHHGHADENSFTVLMDDRTVLLHDGGYRPTTNEGWRADLFHNRLVARLGWPDDGDVVGYLSQNRQYHAVRTEKIHFGNFGSIDYSRTRLMDDQVGYTGDRMVLFVVDPGMYIVVDSIRIDRAGHKLFVNMWHPDQVLKQGSCTAGVPPAGTQQGAAPMSMPAGGQRYNCEDYTVSWPSRIAIRQEYWPNEHNKELLIQFLENRDKIAGIKEITRRFNPSKAFFQYMAGYFYAGQRLTFVTVLTPHKPGSFSDAMLNTVRIVPGSDRESRSLGLSFEINGRPVTVGLKLDQNMGLTNYRGRPMFDFETGSLGYGKLNTDADFAYVMDRGGEVEFAAMNVSRVMYGGKTLFDMPLNKHMYQGPGEYRVPAIKDKMPRWHEVRKLP